MLILLVQVTHKAWPECRSFSGAAQKYLADALKLHRQQRQRLEFRQEAEENRRQEQQAERDRLEQERHCQAAWDALTPLEQEAARQRVLDRLAGFHAPEPFIRRLCLEEMEKLAQPRP
jgi:hypothetical protein